MFGPRFRSPIPVAKAMALAALACARRLRQDRSGNTLAMIAAALVPLLAMVGGAIDMGRSYLAQTRLQQACDAGVLAARKRLGTSAAAGGEIPSDVTEVGDRFFNVNFPDGSYGTTGRDFELVLDADFQLSGTAEVTVPTTIMTIFGIAEVPVNTTCGAEVGVANTDIVLALDVTGSMNLTNPGDSRPRIEELKDTVKTFHAQIQAASAPGSRIRYGFVPYATNVNSASLLTDEQVVDSWTYQSRRLLGTGTASGTTSFWAVGSVIGGTIDTTISSTYAATAGGSGFICGAAPASTLRSTSVLIGTTTSAFAGPPAGTMTRSTYHYTYNGSTFEVKLNGRTCEVHETRRTNYKVSYDWVTQPTLARGSNWQYRPIDFDVSNWRSEAIGCMEEPDTYEIDDYENVDLSRAKDLDLDRVPVAGDPTTQWRPMYPGRIYARALKWNNTGAFSTTVVTTTDEFYNPQIGDTAHCPNPAQRLAEMDDGDVDAYLASLKVGGSTYHDIGMLWAARLVAPTGLFAEDNADVAPNQPTSRHIVFMTDGQTSAMDLSYTAYGFEPLDRRRWSPSSTRNLTQTVEDRFAFICEEAKKRNITIWVVAFGTEMNPMMETCAGPGRAFAAQNGEELAEAFTAIANSIADLRLVR
ncbi:MAG: VWA domain-containing protein [Sphingomonadales bacterium]|nr:VWA domain-containing protein [Sphingomonadales bacterium]